ncbi:BTAD domain-containing putative transcriptional regulator [Streptomyces physcomitrii]|uniref:BTAD domain-containing putative transcriptional regulator n=1 Tax=Streptomyces physcomitrii TaxID=2724184 RepID=UPI0033FF5D9A
MRFGVLGPLEVRTDLGRPVRVPEVKVRTLLAGLLAHQGHVVSADQLIEVLWGGAALPANPTASLQAKVSQLRRALEDAEPGARELVQHRPPGYVLRAPDEAVDAGQFRALLARSRTAADPRGKAVVLSDALALWRGPAFADFTRDSFVRTAVASLDEARLTAIEEHAEARLELGEHSLVVEELTPVVTAHPLRERLRRAQMHALHRAGRSVEALDSYTDLRRRLREELGLVPGAAIDALQQAILRQDPGLQDSAPAAEPAVRARTNLPDPVNPLVGREQALADGRRLIRPHRLVTLTGAGGVGKTRLALAVAGGLTSEFPDGVWLVELAGAGAADDPVTAEDLARRVMTVLGIREESEGAGPVASLQGPAERLAQTVAPRRLLLVLDNCEHVVDAVAGLVDRLLASGRGVKVLATSQEPLRVSGETVWAVPPLELPDRDEPAHLERSSAVQLFVARAAAADPSFVLDADSAPSVAAVCRRLDGIPLALELAATRVRALGVRELLARLDDRFQILNSGYRGAPPRQQTLQATIDWSWSLLSPQEQVVLRRLAVHAEGCALSAAEELSAGGGVPRAEVVDILARLVDRSLVVRSEGPTAARFRLLESVWVYAQRRLQESGEAEEIAVCHARYYTELAERARPRLHGPGQQNRLRLLAAEAANFRQALETAKRTGAAPLALRIVNALAWYWFLSGRLGEACRFLACALETEGPAPAVATAEAATWGEGFRLLLGEGEPDEECDRAGRTGSAERTVGRARAEWFLGFAQWEVGNSAASEEHVNRALLDFRALQDPWGVAAALNSRAALAMARGDLAALRDNALEARAQFDRLLESPQRQAASPRGSGQRTKNSEFHVIPHEVSQPDEALAPGRGECRWSVGALSGTCRTASSGAVDRSLRSGDRDPRGRPPPGAGAGPPPDAAGGGRAPFPPPEVPGSARGSGALFSPGVRGARASAGSGVLRGSGGGTSVSRSPGRPGPWSRRPCPGAAGRSAERRPYTRADAGGSPGRWSWRQLAWTSSQSSNPECFVLSYGSRARASRRARAHQPSRSSMCRAPSRPSAGSRACPPAWSSPGHSGKLTVSRTVTASTSAKTCRSWETAQCPPEAPPKDRKATGLACHSRSYQSIVFFSEAG